MLPGETGIEPLTVPPTIPNELTLLNSPVLDPIGDSDQVEAINTIRTLFGLHDLPVEFIEVTLMLDSPNMDLHVVLYKDSDGRKYYVDPSSNQVVEIDARDALTLIPFDSTVSSQEELRAIAQKYIQQIMPDLELLKTELSFDEGIKGDYYFFTWRSTDSNTYKNKPFIQIGLNKSSELFAYYNTRCLLNEP